MSIWREAITDENGRVDVAYLSLAVVASVVLGAVVFNCFMSGLSFLLCAENTKVQPPILCRYDPQPLGVSVGSICAGFAAALAALAGYMAATRPRALPQAPSPIQVETAQIVNATAPKGKKT